MQKNNLSIWYIILFATFIIWGTQHPPIKLLADRLDPFLFNFLRYSIAAIALLPFVVRNKTNLEKKNLPAFLLLGFILFLYGFINVSGVKLSTATNNAILLNSWPLFVIFAAPFLIGEKIFKKDIVAALIGFAGVVLVVSQGNDIENLIKSEFFKGNVLILISGFCTAIYSILSKKYIAKYGSLNITFYAIAAAAIILFLFFLITNKIFLINQINLNSLLLLLWVAIPTTAFTYVVWFKTIDKIGLVKTSSFFFLIPISGILSSVIFLQEKITYFTLMGTLLILTGIYITQKK